MSAYYNEWDRDAAAWLRELIKRGLIADGDVDERSITEVEANEISGYTQHHFFAGIGGWSLALRMAGWPDARPICTGSPPCQPFSTAGKQLGTKDDRHLAPAWLSLVATLRPAFVAGEQVAAAVKKDNWLDDLLDGLEAEGYTTGAIVLPACSVGAPHIRQRLWFVGRLGDGERKRLEGHDWNGNRSRESGRIETYPARPVAETGGAGGLADTHYWHPGFSGDQQPAKTERRTYRAYTDYGCASHGRGQNGSADAIATGWNDPDWMFCRDANWRPVESGTFPLADGIPGRVGRLRGYGNAIVPQVAAEVIRCLMDARP